MKTGFFNFPFYAFAIALPTFASTADEISTLNQSMIRSQSSQGDYGDFDRLNELLETISINIDDDMAVSEKVGLITLNLLVDSLTCRDIRIGDIAVNHNGNDSDSASTNSIDVDIALNGIDAACDIEFEYEYGFLEGTAKAEIMTHGNAADTSIEFLTYKEKGDFVVNSSVSKCVVDVEISDVNFIDPDFAMSVLGLFEQYLRDLVEKEIESYACDQLSTTGVTTLNENLFAMINDELLEYATLEGNGATDATSLESNYDVTKALNFREIAETQIGKLFERALGQVNQLFGSGDDDDGELGINNLLRSYILDENGALVLNIERLLGKDASSFEFHDEIAKSKITFEEVRVYGLDSLTKFDPLVITGNHTIRNEFSWNFLNIQVDAFLDIRPSSLEKAILKQDTNSEQKGIVEKIVIQIGAENVDMVASLFALIDLEASSNFTLGSLLSSTNTEDYTWLLPCLMPAIQELHFVELEISPQKINVPTLEGFIDDGVDRVLSDVAEIAFELYHDFLVQEILPNMIKNTGKTFVNDLIANVLEDSKSSSDACPTYEVVADDDAEIYVDFRELFYSSVTAQTDSEYGKIPSMLRDLMETEFLEEDPTTGMPKINDVLIDTLTKQQSGTEGTFLFGGGSEDIFRIGQRINIGGFDATVRISASDVKIENLDTVLAPLVLLEPVPTEPYFLNNSVAVGLEDRPLKLTGTFSFAMKDNVEGVEISNEVEISFDTHTASVLATAMLKVVKSRLLGFPVVDIFDWNCWMATIPAPTLNKQGVSIGDGEVNATIVDFAASVSGLYLNVTCLECTSPGIVELSELLTSSGEAQNDVTLLANTLLLSAGEMVKGDLMQVQIDRLLDYASKQCRHSPNYDPSFVRDYTSPRSRQFDDFEAIKIENSTEYLVLVGVVSLACVLAVALLFFSLRCFTRHRHSRWLARLPVEEGKVLKQMQLREASLESALNSTTGSMFQSREDIPSFVRFGMPFVILGNIALFISGHLNLGATVNIKVMIAGEKVEVDQFFEFSIAKSTIDIWNAGGKELAILILIFSGIWPYTKQLLTLILWFSPTSWVSISRRGSILLWLDWMAKWSMIDIFVLIICLTAFRVSVNSPNNLAFLPEGFYSLDLLVVPLWGLYANMIAQLVSQLSSHFIIHYHRKIFTNAKDSYFQSSANHSSITRRDSGERGVLHAHQFRRPHRNEQEKLIVKTWVNYALISLALTFSACIIAGCVFPSYSIEVFGLLGIAVEAGQEFPDAKTDHSVFTVIELLWEQAKFLDAAKDYVGLGSFSTIFLSTVLLVPLLQALVLLAHWFVPMTMKQRTKMSVFVEILQAWQYAEVYLISIFVASWQLGPISSFMVNDYCGSLDGFFSELVFYGILKAEDAQCFSVKSSIEGGFFILVTGAILLSLVNGIVTKATIQYSRDLDNPGNGQNEIQDAGSFDLEFAEEGEEVVYTKDLQSSIQPPPVLFTDTFRWLMKDSSGVKKPDIDVQESGDTQDS